MISIVVVVVAVVIDVVVVAIVIVIMETGIQEAIWIEMRRRWGMMVHQISFYSIPNSIIK